MSAPMDENAVSCHHENKENLTESARWKPRRPCEEYLQNLKKCRSFYGRFHHYYVYGTKQDCNILRIGYESCIEWEKTQSNTAKAKLEELQHEEDLKQTKHPRIWEPRTHPPARWNDPVHIAHTDKSNVVT